MRSLTGFRPNPDGFAFTNSWHWDDTEKRTLRNIISSAVPLVETITAPLIDALSGGLLSAQAAIAGPFAPLVLYYEIGAINEAITNAIVNAIEDSDDGVYGLCGGMAFAALDYWNQQWVVPRGSDAGDQPQRDTVEGDTLRSYIWQRLVDSLTANALTFLSWMAVLHLPFAGGSAKLRDWTLNEWERLKHLIDNSSPATLGLIGTTLSPFQNHQVLAYGYEDLGNGQGRLFLYDNNAPGQESVTSIDFRGPTLVAVEDARDPHRGPLQGFFVTNYRPALPPHSVILTRSLATSPHPCVEAGRNVQVSYGVENVGYHDSPPLALKVGTGSGPIAGETLLVSLGEGASRSVDTNMSFSSGTWSLVAAADLGTPMMPPAVEVPVPAVRRLPPEDSSVSPMVKIEVLPVLTIRQQSVNGQEDECAVAGAGAEVQYNVDIRPLGGPPSPTYQWQVSGNAQLLSPPDAPTADVRMPSDAPQTVTISVVVTRTDGCTTSGTLAVELVSSEVAGIMEALCRFFKQYRVFRHLLPGQILPDPELIVQLAQLRDDAARVVEGVSQLSQLRQSGEGPRDLKSQ